MDTMHRRNEILSYGASRGVVVLGILLWPMLIATKKTYATRIRTADAEVPKVQAWTPSRTDLGTTTAWLGGSDGLGSILGISENAYRHTQPEKTRKIIIFAFNKRKNYRLTIKIVYKNPKINIIIVNFNGSRNSLLINSSTQVGEFFWMIIFYFLCKFSYFLRFGCTMTEL